MHCMSINIAGHSEREILDTLDNLVKAIVHKDKAALGKLEEGAMVSYEMTRDFNKPRDEKSKKK